MQLLEGSDTRVRFKIREVENNITYDFDLTEFTGYKLEIRFSDDSVKEFNGVVDIDTLYFDIFGEFTEGKSGGIKADIRGVKNLKKVRFNPTTIKGKVLPSVYVPKNASV